VQHCHVTIRCIEPGVAALLTGLSMLASRGELRLSLETLPAPAPRPDGPWHLRDKAESGTQLVLDGRHRAYFDIHDSWEIESAEYEAHDLYFKRSYDATRFSAASHPKLRPLGLIGDVRGDGFDAWELRRILAQRVPLPRRLADAGRFMIHTLAAVGFNEGPRPNLSLLRAPPDPALQPRVLFMAGLWDPKQVPPDAPGKADEFTAINETRAACIRLLRRTFGTRFFGGVIHSEFARRHYPDVLLPEARTASKRDYIKRVRHFPVCIATTGLHGSNGWKLGEYVGLSRAIVTEPLRYLVPGPFAAGTNYLEFSTPEACVQCVGELLDSPERLTAQMAANWSYYNAWMRPDALARHVLDTMNGAGR